MLDCICVETMRLSDRQTIEQLVPGLTLMARAAWGVYLAQDWTGPVAIAAGSGNNGGDGFALACILAGKQIPCTVFTLGSRLSPDSAHYAEKARALGVPVRPFSEGCLAGFATVADCLLGTGFQGDLRPDYRDAIRQINASGARVVSVDINSGMNGDTGLAREAVRSHLTVTVGFVKTGLVTPAAGQYIGRLRCADIGIRLARQEQTLCSRAEWDALAPSDRDSGRFLLSPPWLDMTRIPAADTPAL